MIRRTFIAAAAFLVAVPVALAGDTVDYETGAENPSPFDPDRAERRPGTGQDRCRNLQSDNQGADGQRIIGFHRELIDKPGGRENALPVQISNSNRKHENF